MKYGSINVNFTDPVAEVKRDLLRKDARNISIRRNFRGEIEVSYTLKADEPEKRIIDIISGAGAQSVKPMPNSYGARFDFRVEDSVDLHEYKKKLIDLLRKGGFRSS
ncbi:MAG: hypothetical protein J6Y65_01945 [Eggerthellaceae bacterium]|nr:hypothetical protein [Eggerthellaceae bacterium]